MKVLIVLDYVSLAKMLREALEREGNEVDEVVESGLLITTKLNDFQPDLIITDPHTMWGDRKLYERMREHMPTPVPVIVVGIGVHGMTQFHLGRVADIGTLLSAAKFIVDVSKRIQNG